MGKSKDIEALDGSNDKFQAYLKKITIELQQKAESHIKDMNKEIDDYYAQNGWKSEKFIAGKNADFMHTSVWSLDRVTEIVNAISGAVFGGTPPPKGTEVTPTPDIGAALATMANLQLYFASRVVVALTGILEAFGSSTSISFRTQYKSEVLGNGFHLFTVMACDSYDSEGFFEKERIIEYLYAYDLRFSSGEAKSHAKIALVDALTDAINALGKKIKEATKKWMSDLLSDAQYKSVLGTYKEIQDELMDQLRDLSAENKKALRSMVAVPSMMIEDSVTERKAA